MRHVLSLLPLISLAFAPAPPPRPRPPDISGAWSSKDWGLVVLLEKGRGGYEGTYTATYGPAPGYVRLEWSPKLLRFIGTWGENGGRLGSLSVTPQPDGKTVKGAYSADLACKIDAGCPKQSELEWGRPAPKP